MSREILILLAALSCVLASPPIHLINSDFAHGSYLIETPGRYVLDEDVSFDPNPAIGGDAYDSGFPLPDQLKSNGGPYDDHAFSLGFFAAIVISAEDVTLDLNGHKIEQSEEHALLQRFFAVIELADQPFVPGQGPHDFGLALSPAKRVTIRDGTIGRSSHHGIHGNGNEDVAVRNVVFDGYEVGALALNGVKKLRVKNCDAVNRKDVPVLGTFSSARFIQHYVDHLNSVGSATSLTVGGVSLSVSDVRNRLISAVNGVFDDVVTRGLHYIDPVAHPEEYDVFHNDLGLLDGNSYAFLTNKLGVAVLGFPTHPNTFAERPSRDVEFEDVRVTDHHAFINEIVAINKGGPVIDPVGAVFQVKNKSPTGNMATVTDEADSLAEYKGNPIANAQALVAKAIIDGEFDGTHLDVSRNGIDEDVLAWIEATPGSPEAKLSALISDEGYLCNGDSMFHVNKGVISFKIDSTVRAKLKNIRVTGVRNLGDMGSLSCGNYTKSHPAATLEGYGGAHVRAFSFAGSSRVEVKDVRVSNVRSEYGNAYAFDAFTDSDKIELKNVEATDVVSVNEKALGVRFGPDTMRCELRDWCVSGLSGPKGTYLSLDEGTNNDVRAPDCN